jgi:hypothetical protein
MTKMVFKITKKTIADDTRIGSLFCFKSCSVNNN